MADARGPDLVENLRRGIGLDGIERVARKAVEEAARRGTEFFRKDAIDGLARLQRRDRLFDRGEARHGVDACRCVQAETPRWSDGASLRQRERGVKKRLAMSRFGLGSQRT